MTKSHREGEPDYLMAFKRGPRLIINKEGYFYRTRECDMIGPFKTESEAMRDMRTFVMLSSHENDQASSDNRDRDEKQSPAAERASATDI